MEARTAQRVYTIKEAEALTGLPASTLRYYESIGVITPIARGASSGHRVYDDADLDQLMWIRCLAATGMSVNDMRRYIANSQPGSQSAAEQVELLSAQELRLGIEAEQLLVRQSYVRIKIQYWRAVAIGDDTTAERLSDQARALADQLRHRPAATYK